MFSTKLKAEISDAVQAILRDTKHHELPDGEIDFLLHVDGKGCWGWANIRNNGSIYRECPENLQENLTLK